MASAHPLDRPTGRNTPGFRDLHVAPLIFFTLLSSLVLTNGVAVTSQGVARESSMANQNVNLSALLMSYIIASGWVITQNATAREQGGTGERGVKEVVESLEWHWNVTLSEKQAISGKCLHQNSLIPQPFTCVCERWKPVSSCWGVLTFSSCYQLWQLVHRTQTVSTKLLLLKCPRVRNTMSRKRGNSCFAPVCGFIKKQ